MVGGGGGANAWGHVVICERRVVGSHRLDLLLTSLVPFRSRHRVPRLAGSAEKGCPHPIRPRATRSGRWPPPNQPHPQRLRLQGEETKAIGPDNHSRIAVTVARECFCSSASPSHGARSCARRRLPPSATFGRGGGTRSRAERGEHGRGVGNPSRRPTRVECWRPQEKAARAVGFDVGNGVRVPRTARPRSRAMRAKNACSSRFLSTRFSDAPIAETSIAEKIWFPTLTSHVAPRSEAQTTFVVSDFAKAVL
jgi:hypothetical protein